MKNKANFGSRSIGAGFGSPPPGGGSSQGGGSHSSPTLPKCYTLTHSWELVLSHVNNSLRCNWEVTYNNHWNLLWRRLSPPTNDPDYYFPYRYACDDTNCPPFFAGTVPIITLEPDNSNGTPRPLAVCELLALLESGVGLADIKIKMKQVTTRKGCKEHIENFYPFFGGIPGGPDIGDGVANLLSIGNDFFCEPQNPLTPDYTDLEGDAEEIFRKILACLCKIARETDPDKRAKLQDNLQKKMNECARKWNKHASLEDQKEALGYGPNELVPVISVLPQTQKEAAQDLTSLRYQQCLSEIDDFCAD